MMDIFSVSEINEHIKELFEDDALLSGVCVRGELSNFKTYPSGHSYFTLKDENASLRCVMFRRDASRLKFRPENGMGLLAVGRVAVYPRDGQYQLYCVSLEPDGLGALHMAFEQLKEKLRREGLFDAALKKPLPPFPEKIAVVTSSAGAAVRDIIRIAGRRWPLAKITVVPVRVQGAEAPEEIASAIALVNALGLSDLIITGRGGGSLEDLWAFNDERVARAIFQSEIPVISAVGHEPDVTIADFVADARASTPSNASELAVPDSAEIRAAVSSLKGRMESAAASALSRKRRSIERLRASRVLQSPDSFLSERRMRLEMASEKLLSAQTALLRAKSAQNASLAASLDALSPLKVLGRGYAIARGENGVLIKSRSDVFHGDKIKLTVADGEINCEVIDNEI